MEYFKLRLVRLSPLFALVLFIAWLGPGKIERLRSALNRSAHAVVTSA